MDCVHRQCDCNGRVFFIGITPLIEGDLARSRKIKILTGEYIAILRIKIFIGPVCAPQTDAEIVSVSEPARLRKDNFRSGAIYVRSLT